MCVCVCVSVCVCVCVCVSLQYVKLQQAQTCGCSRYAGCSCDLCECVAWPFRFPEVLQHLLLCRSICIALTLVQHIDECVRICPVSFSLYVNVVCFLENNVPQVTLIPCPVGYGAVQALAGALPNMTLTLIVSACGTVSRHVSVGVSTHVLFVCQPMC